MCNEWILRFFKNVISSKFMDTSAINDESKEPIGRPSSKVNSTFLNRQILWSRHSNKFANSTITGGIILNFLKISVV